MYQVHGLSASDLYTPLFNLASTKRLLHMLMAIRTNGSLSLSEEKGKQHQKSTRPGGCPVAIWVSCDSQNTQRSLRGKEVQYGGDFPFWLLRHVTHAFCLMFALIFRKIGILKTLDHFIRVYIFH